MRWAKDENSKMRGAGKSRAGMEETKKETKKRIMRRRRVRWVAQRKREGEERRARYIAPLRGTGGKWREARERMAG